MADQYCNLPSKSVYSITPFSFSQKMDWANVIKMRCSYGLLHRGEIPERFETLAWSDRPPNNFPFSSEFFFVFLTECKFLFSFSFLFLFRNVSFLSTEDWLTLASANDRLSILTCIQESSCRHPLDNKLGRCETKVCVQCQISNRGKQTLINHFVKLSKVTFFLDSYVIIF